jgi:hypothetical protein
MHDGHDVDRAHARSGPTADRTRLIAGVPKRRPHHGFDMGSGDMSIWPTCPRDVFAVADPYGRLRAAA